MKFFQRALIFTGEPSKLALDKFPGIPSKSYKSFETVAELGFANNDEVEWHLVTLAEQRGAQLVCMGKGSLEVSKGAVYERAARLWCEGWTFRQGDPFTVVSFSGPKGDNWEYVDPTKVDHVGFDGMIDSAVNTGSDTEDPNIWPQHTLTYFWYVADDNMSHFTQQDCAQNPYSVDLVVTRADFIKEVLQGAPDNAMRGLQHVIVESIVIMGMFSLAHTMIFGLYFVVLIGTMIWMCVKKKTKVGCSKLFCGHFCFFVGGAYLFGVLTNLSVPVHVITVNKHDAAILHRDVYNDDLLKQFQMVVNGAGAALAMYLGFKMSIGVGAGVEKLF